MWVWILLYSLALLALLGAVGGWLVHRSEHHNQFLFQRLLDPEDRRRRMLGCLERIAAVLDRHGISYWLDQGTLLGAYRHQGFIPWDMDIDIAIESTSHERLWALRGELEPPYRLIQVSKLWMADKLLPFLRHLIPRRTFLRLVDFRTGEFVDIFEYRPDGDQGMEALPWTLTNYRATEETRTGATALRTHPREQIFPLDKTLEFEGAAYPVPAQTEAYLHHVYGDDLSPDREWSEEAGAYVKKVSQ
ncbi:MAG: LicD family protein [bacterium]